MEKPRRLFTNPKAISRHLMCNICNEVYDDPTRLPCGHTFCRDCIEAWLKRNKQCPNCRKKLTVKKLSRDMVAANIIGELEVMCKHRGCMWQGDLQDMEIHENSCKFHPSKVESWLIESLPSKEYNDEDGVSQSGSGLLSSLYEKYGASALKAVKTETLADKQLIRPKVLFFDDLSDEEANVTE